MREKEISWDQLGLEHVGRPIRVLMSHGVSFMAIVELVQRWQDGSVSMYLVKVPTSPYKSDDGSRLFVLES
jgi:hypothetical protein